MIPLTKKSIKYFLFDLAVIISFVVAACFLRGRGGGQSLSAQECHITDGDAHQQQHPQTQQHQDFFDVEVADKMKKIENELIERLSELTDLVHPVLDEVDKLSDIWSDAWTESHKTMLVELFITRTMDQYNKFKGKVDEFNELDERLTGMGGGLKPEQRKKMDTMKELGDVVDGWRGMASLDRIMSR